MLMSDLHERFRSLDGAPAPYLWNEIERRAAMVGMTPSLAPVHATGPRQQELAPVRRRTTGRRLALVAAVALLLVTPPITTFFDGITSRSMWTGLHARLLPSDRWFGIIVEQGRLAAGPTAPEAPTTGSLPEATPPAPATPAR